MERIYNVPLRSGYINTPKYKRAKKAITTLQIFLKKHMKAEEVKIGQHLNHHIWKNGIKNPPHHVKVKAVKDEEGIVKAELEGFDFLETVKPQEPEQEKGLAQKLLGAGKDKEEKETTTKDDKKDDKKEETKPEDKEKPSKEKPKEAKKDKPAKKEVKKASKPKPTKAKAAKKAPAKKTAAKPAKTTKKS
ncbi:50S ribosomal protein L31e [Nanoarchaeota archaeon]